MPVRLAIRPLLAAGNLVFRGRWLVGALIAMIAAASTLAAAQSAPAPPAASTPAAPAPTPAPPRFVVVLDAAHGGDDLGGSLTNNQQEKTITLALSARLRSLLEARGIPVAATRDADTTVELNRRAEIANHTNAQACLSLHASESGSGVHLFVSSLAPAQPTRFAAWKTAQSAWVTRSLALAGTLNSDLLQAGMTVTLGRTSLPVVDSMACPAVAIEIAPERGPGKKIDAELDDPDYQARVAAALAAALLDWRSEVRQP